MKQKGLPVFLITMLLAICLFILPTEADANVSDYLGWEVVNGVAQIVYCDFHISGDIAIPSRLGGYTVTSIGYNAFEYCVNVTGITLPNTVTTIEYGAFRGCSALKNITVPASVDAIEDGAFDGCYNLQNVRISNMAAWCDIRFGNYANPLYYADNLYLNGNLVTDLVVPNGVATIRRSAFLFYDKLTSVSLPNSVTNIEYYAFQGCENLRSIDLPDNLQSIGAYAFWSCDGLAEIDIPDRVTAVAESTFDYCTNLSRVTLGDSVTEIGYRAFAGCDSLTEITIPASVQSIEYCAFDESDRLADVYYGGTEIQWNAVEIGRGNRPLQLAQIHCQPYLAKPGDLTGDNGVTSDDVIQLLLHISMPGLFPLDASGDFTGDGIVTSDDVIQLLLHISMPDLFPLRTT